jgi:hypothetical protein
MNLVRSNVTIVFMGVVTLVVALASVYFPSIILMYALGVLVVSSTLVVLSRNKYGIAHLMSGYIVGIEVFFRMVKTGVPWEYGKYAVIVLLSLGLLMEKRKPKIPKFFLFYLLLFIPSILLTFGLIDFERARQLVVSNIGGQLVLFVSVLYFYKRKFSDADFQVLSKMIIIGIIAMTLFTYFRISDFIAIAYTANSNPEASGGFSGNQVSTVYGLGIVLLGISLYRSKVLFSSKVVDAGLFFTFLLFGFLTFSRGGMAGAFLTLIITVFVYKFLTPRQNKINKSGMKLRSLIIIGIVISSAFFIINQLTGDILQQRYLNVDKYGEYRESKDITTNRGKIFSADIKLFEENLITGVGVGMGFSERKQYLGFVTASHTEFSRILAEHGFLGLFILTLMLFLPLYRYIKSRRSPETILILTALVIYAFITMTHSAMRLALPGFIYGVGMIYLVRNELKNEK